jgi:hypothetical protein
MTRTTRATLFAAFLPAHAAGVAGAPVPIADRGVSGSRTCRENARNGQSGTQVFPRSVRERFAWSMQPPRALNWRSHDRTVE